jgi:ribosomal protein S18 acetylase RimI-like enzyme
MTVAVREATEADLDGITELWSEMLEYHHQLGPLVWTVAPDGREKVRSWYREALGAEERLMLVADEAGEVVGFAHGMLGDGPPPLVPRRAANVTDLAVRSTHRRQGIGRALMEALADRLAERGRWRRSCRWLWAMRPLGRCMRRWASSP